MRCPRCKRQHDILQYIPMMLNEEFAEETVPIYKCPDCRWIFAPVDNVIMEQLKLREGDSLKVRQV